jgi:hypothetical protein
VINHSDYSEKIEFLDRDKKVKTKVNLAYYWLKSQRVLVTQGDYSGYLLHGHYESFYPNNSLRDKGKFSYGLKVGLWNYWRIDGSLEKTENWKKGEIKGNAIIYDHNGLDSLIIPYKNNLKNGKVYEVFGNKRKHVETYKRGVLKMDKVDKVQLKFLHKKKNVVEETSEEKVKEREEHKSEEKEKKATRKKDKLNKDSDSNKDKDSSVKKKGLFNKKKQKEESTEKPKKEKNHFFKGLFKKDKSEKSE